MLLRIMHMMLKLAIKLHISKLIIVVMHVTYTHSRFSSAIAMYYQSFVGQVDLLVTGS